MKSQQNVGGIHKSESEAALKNDLQETPNMVNTNSEVRNFRLSSVIQNNWKVGSVSSLDIKTQQT